MKQRKPCLYMLRLWAIVGTLLTLWLAALLPIASVSADPIMVTPKMAQPLHHKQVIRRARRLLRTSRRAHRRAVRAAMHGKLRRSARLQRHSNRLRRRAQRVRNRTY